jgi:serine/threonine-protein kinase
MALVPDERFASAAVMAEALERYQAEHAAAQGPAAALGSAAATAGAAAATAGAASAAAAGMPATSPPAADAAPLAAVEPGPGPRVPYPLDAYAGVEPGRRGGSAGAGRRAPDDMDGIPDEERTGTSPWLWVSGGLAIAILALAAFLVFRLLSGETAPPADQVAVPNFVGMSYASAQAEAEKAGLEVARSAFEPSDQPDGTVLAQTPEAGATVDPGRTIELTLALGDETVAVPDLRGKSESEALNLIAGAKLAIGTRTEAFDAFIPAGAVVEQDPGPGVVVTQGLAVNYIVSKGLEPSAPPEASPSPSPSPTPEVPPPPTVEPTVPPTPAPVNVGDYRCLVLADATTAILGDGFVVGAADGDTTGKVVAQAPGPGAKVAIGTPINLTFENPPVSFLCP